MTSATRTRSGRAMQACASLTALTLATAGCSSDKGGEAKPSIAASASQDKPSHDPNVAEKRKVLKVFNSYWEEQIKAFAQASPEGTELNRYASDEALGSTLGSLVDMSADGTVMRGKPKISGKVTAIDVEASPKKAVITGCYDVEAWNVVSKETGRPLNMPSDRLVRYVSTVTARTFGDRWMIVKDVPQERSC